MRAITEKYYGRTARLFNFMDVGKAVAAEPFMFLRQVMDESVIPPPGVEATGDTIPHARIPAEKAREYFRRVMEMADEFSRQESVPGERVYAFLAGVYLTDLPELPGDKG